MPTQYPPQVLMPIKNYKKKIIKIWFVYKQNTNKIAYKKDIKNQPQRIYNSSSSVTLCFVKYFFVKYFKYLKVNPFKHQPLSYIGNPSIQRNNQLKIPTSKNGKNCNFHMMEVTKKTIHTADMKHVLFKLFEYAKHTMLCHCHNIM